MTLKSEKGEEGIGETKLIQRLDFPQETLYLFYRSSRLEVLFYKEGVLKISQNPQENTCASLFFNKLGTGTGVFL